MLRRGIVLIAVAIIWAAVIAAVASIARGSPLYDRLLLILGGGAAATLIVVGGGLTTTKRK
jgi:hypothetical protein